LCQRWRDRSRLFALSWRLGDAVDVQSLSQPLCCELEIREAHGEMNLFFEGRSVDLAFLWCGKLFLCSLVAQNYCSHKV
jgi:hypothetical protein